MLRWYCKFKVLFLGCESATVGSNYEMQRLLPHQAVRYHSLLFGYQDNRSYPIFNSKGVFACNKFKGECAYFLDSPKLGFEEFFKAVCTCTYFELMKFGVSFFFCFFFLKSKAFRKD